MKLRHYEDCFNICVDELQDNSEAEKLAQYGLSCHDNDKRIHHFLFKKLKASNDENHLKLATTIMQKNSRHINCIEIAEEFKDDDDIQEE